MAVTVTTDAAGPGKGGTRPLFVQGPRKMKLVTGTIAFDNSYPTGGESLSEIFNLFTEVAFFFIEQPLTGAQTGKFAKIDYTNKKALLYTNASPAAEVANASDQSAISVRFAAIGY